MKVSKEQRNMILGSLFAMLFLLVIAYGAFRTILDIEGTTSIDSRWDVHIKDGGVSAKNAVDATSSKAIKKDQLTAEYECSLTTPGKSTIDYDVIVENSGTFGAKLSSIIVTGETNYIGVSLSKSSLTEGKVITANGGTDVITVTINYKDVAIAPTGDDTIAHITVTLNFVQDDGIVVPTEPEEPTLTIDPTFVPQYYEFHTGNNVVVGSSADTSSWTQDSNTLEKNYYLGHDVDGSGNVTANYACFIIDNTQYCMKATSDGSEFETNKTLLGTLKDNDKITCTTWDSENAICSAAAAGLGRLYASYLGVVRAGVSSAAYCYGLYDGNSTCNG